jgi:hypothetical protein
MRPVILVPWRPTPERRPLWRRVKSHLEGLGWPIVTADSPTELFSLAQAFNQAAEAADGLGRWTVAVLSEADVWCPLPQIQTATEWGEGLTYCYDRQLRFTIEETRRHLETGVMPDRELQDAMSHLGSNGVRTITRDLWNQVGGYDPRFVGWGGEDWDFWNRCTKAGTVSRIQGPMWEYGHAREPDYYEARHENRRWLAEKVKG